MADGDLISRASLLAGIAELKESPWYNYGKYEGDFYDLTVSSMIDMIKYSERKEAIAVIIEQCIEKETAVEAEPDNGWISVKDRLPDEGTEVLIYCPDFLEEIRKAFYTEGDFYAEKEDLIVKPAPNGYCTHWQPLPNPPKGE